MVGRKTEAEIKEMNEWWSYLRNWWAYYVGNVLYGPPYGMELCIFLSIDEELFWRSER
ncbi:unnamed protein product [marine sediment metagenome]|uniref:Uncharacterized protein n=1 Tax=marine sediment metagenome TaxID=412755 RepID=X1TZ35_9ZZZZ